MSISKGCEPRQNQLLAALSETEYQRLVPNLELVSLPLHKVIYEPGQPITHVYFPHQALVSLVSLMEDGSTVEVGLVGNEGMVGLPVIWGGDTTTTRAFVQIADSGSRMKASLLKIEFDRGDQLQTLLLRYMQALHTQISQLAACNRLHMIEGRLARWLLSVHDRMQKDEFPLTHEFIGQMLGTRRAGVSEAAGVLSQAGMIRYTRGKITILDRPKLEATACECYGLVKSEFTRLLSPECN
ncbi:MAG TPA: Crp/Fnr family transcriptional regulator [Leptolyngbyaceae cyanobacterium]